jgi:DNA-directed RNA polymerase subunit L/DNA-directed RNA polymerase alpha subunit
MFANYKEDPSSAPLLSSDADHRLRADFVLLDTNMTIANTIRRAILTQTPSVGFRTEPYEKSDITISINTTPLVNEMIAHRIGMIPINANPLTFNPDLFMFDLDVENKTKEIIDVRAEHFKVYMRDPKKPLEEPVQVDTKTLFPPDPITGETVLITRLRPQWNPTAPNERIKLRGRASVCTGSENIRWSPVCQASYEYTLDADEGHLQEVFTRWLARNKKIENLADVDPARLEELKAEFRTMEIQRCYLTDAAGNPNNFTFHVESIGIQAIPAIVHNALVSCEVLVKKYQDIDGGAALPNVRIQEGDSRFPSIDFIFTNESHTLGNLLATWLVDNKISDATDNVITYAGYKVPHPLRPEMFVRVGVKEGLDVDVRKQTARQAVAEACKELMKLFRVLTLAWDEVSGATPAPPAEEGVAATPETAATSANSGNSATTASSANSGSSDNSRTTASSANSISSANSGANRASAVEEEEEEEEAGSDVGSSEEDE